MRWKRENKLVEKALEDEIKDRVKTLGAQNPHGFGSLPSSNSLNESPNDLTSTLQQMYSLSNSLSNFQQTSCGNMLSGLSTFTNVARAAPKSIWPPSRTLQPY